MYEINKLLHGKRFVRDFHTRWFCIRNLTRSLRSLVRFQILHQLDRVKIPYARAFHEVISIYFTTQARLVCTELLLQHFPNFRKKLYQL